MVLYFYYPFFKYNAYPGLYDGREMVIFSIYRFLSRIRDFFKNLLEKRRILGIIGIFLIVIFYSLRIYTYNKTWENDEVLCKKVLNRYPENVPILNYLGNYYYTKDNIQEASL